MKKVTLILLTLCSGYVTADVDGMLDSISGTIEKIIYSNLIKNPEVVDAMSDALQQVDVEHKNLWPEIQRELADIADTTTQTWLFPHISEKLIKLYGFYERHGKLGFIPFRHYTPYSILNHIVDERVALEQVLTTALIDKFEEFEIDLPWNGAETEAIVHVVATNSMKQLVRTALRTGFLFPTRYIWGKMPRMRIPFLMTA